MNSTVPLVYIRAVSKIHSANDLLKFHRFPSVLQKPAIWIATVILEFIGFHRSETPVAV